MRIWPGVDPDPVSPQCIYIVLPIIPHQGDMQLSIREGGVTRAIPLRSIPSARGMGQEGHPWRGGGKQWRRMMLPSGAHSLTQSGQQWGRCSHPTWIGGTTPGPSPRSRSGSGSSTLQRGGGGGGLTGWSDSFYIAPCATPANPNNVPEPAPPGGNVSRSYDDPLKE